MPSYSKSESKEWARYNVKGQWSTLISPFTEDDLIDEGGLRKNIRRIRSLGTSGVGCTWGMGEFWSLTFSEKIQIYDILADESKGNWMIGAHVTHTSVKEMLNLASHVESLGFDLLMVAAPYMVTKTEQQVVEFVKILAENTSLAIMFNNSPQFGIVMSAEGLKKICDIPNVVGVKEASFNKQLSIDTHILLGDKVLISTPDEWIFAKGKELGFQQRVMFANTSDWRFDMPGKNNYVQFIDKAIEGNIDQDFYDLKIRPIKSISDKWWPRIVSSMNGVLPVSLCKYWGELMGMAGGHVRNPLLNMSDSDKLELKADLKDFRPSALDLLNLKKY